MMKCRGIILSLVMALTAPVIAIGQDAMESNCGNPYDSGGVGPYDYYDPALGDDIDLVVTRHFTQYMEEMAINGSTTRQATIKEELIGGQQLVAGNLDYTLRAIPNHARALYAMGIWQLRIRERSMQDFMETKVAWGFKSAECYFKRAVMFAPDDGFVLLAYAIFRHKQGRFDSALEQYREAIRMMPNSAEVNYNIGLLYVEINNLALAREHARKAYKLGYPLPGLRSKLMRLGAWEPEDGGSVDSSLDNSE